MLIISFLIIECSSRSLYKSLLFVQKSLIWFPLDLFMFGQTLNADVFILSFHVVKNKVYKLLLFKYDHLTIM